MTLKLNFQSDDPFAKSACTAYWEVDSSGDYVKSVKAIACELGLTASRLGETVRNYCVAKDGQLICNHCGDPLEFRSRHERTQQRRVKARQGGKCVICSNCRIRVADELAEKLVRWQEEQRAQKLLQATQLRQQIQEQFGAAPKNQVSIDELSLIDAVYVSAIFNVGGSENYGSIDPLVSFWTRLAPTKELAEDMVSRLYSSGLIAIHEDSDRDAFEELDGGILLPKLLHVKYRPNFAADSESVQRLVDGIRDRFTTGLLPSRWIPEIKGLCKTVAMHEALNLLRIAMMERSMKCPSGKKTRSNLNLILEACSVGQASYLALKCAKNAIDYMAKSNVPRYQAENAVSADLLRTYQYWVERQWQIPAHNRYGKSPESELSRLAFRVIIRGGDDWFIQPIADLIRDRVEFNSASTN